MESYWSNTSDLCQIRSVTLFCRIKKSLIKNVPVQVFVQLSEQLTLGVAKLAVLGALNAGSQVGEVLPALGPRTALLLLPGQLLFAWCSDG